MLGLFLSCVMSVVNVFNDVARKKVLDRQFDAGLVSFWCKAIAFVAYALAIGVLLVWRGIPPELPDIGKTLGFAPLPSLIIYLAFSSVLEGTAILLNLRALQVSPISYCVPFMAFTPLFLLPAGSLLLHERISQGMVLGVLLVVLGSLVVNRQLFARGPLEPVRAIFRERGSRYMLTVAFLLTITNILDKWFVTAGGASVPFDVRVSRSLTLAIGKCVMLALFFVGLTLVRLGDWKSVRARNLRWWRVPMSFNWITVLRTVPLWLVLAGVLEAVILVLQLMAMQFTVAALVISIKRSGMVLAVALGWFIFKERGITDRVIASCVMVTGVLLFFLTKPDTDGQAMLGLHGAMMIAGMALSGMVVALYLTRHLNPIAAGAGPARLKPLPAPGEPAE